MTAAGDVSDYDAATQDSLRSRLALTLDVSTADVSLSVTPASVQLLFSVQVADAAEATTVIDKVTQVLPDAAAAASTLGVSVLTAPVSTARDASVPPLLPLAPPPRLPAASPASPLPAVTALLQASICQASLIS